MREISLNRSESADLSAHILNQGGSFVFKAHGSSMYPFIFDGDILIIKPVDFTNLRTGDVVFHKSINDKLIAHRIVGKKIKNNQLMFLMRGDSVLHNDGWISTGQILGKVVSIQRNQKLIHLDRGFVYSIAYLWNKLYPLGPFSFHLTLKGRKVLSWILRHFQTLKTCRIVARKLFSRKIDYLIATEKDATKLSRFYGYDRLPEIDDPIGLLKNQLRNPNDYVCTFITCEGERIIGATVLTIIPENKTQYPDWWIFGMQVRTCYRGSGIGEGLMRMAMQKASEEGASSLNLLVFEKNKAAINLYRKMGFRQISIPPLDQILEEEVQKGQRRRIIMSRSM